MQLQQNALEVFWQHHQHHRHSVQISMTTIGVHPMIARLYALKDQPVFSGTG